jgi:hypothetical protein
LGGLAARDALVVFGRLMRRNSWRVIEPPNVVAWFDYRSGLRAWRIPFPEHPEGESHLGERY